MRSLDDLLKSLAQATRDGKISWARDASDSNVGLVTFLGTVTPVEGYVATLPDFYSVRIWTWKDHNTRGDGFTAELRKAGDIIDSVQADRFLPVYGDLSTLFASARRSAGKVDEAIGEVARLLETLKPR